MPIQYARKRKALFDADVERTLMSASPEYANTRKKLRTTQHTIMEQFFLHVCKLQPNPPREVVQAFAADFHNGHFGNVVAVRKAVARFGTCNIDPEILKAIHSKPNVNLAPREQTVFAAWQKLLKPKPSTRTMFVENLKTAVGLYGADVCDQFKNLDVRIAARFCLVHGIRNERRYAFVLACGFTKELLDAKIVFYESAYLEAKNVVRKHKFCANANACNVLHNYLDLCDVFDNWQCAEVDDVVRAAKNFKTGSSVLLLLLSHMCHQTEKSGLFLQTAHGVTTKIGALQRVQNLSEFHKTLCDEVRAFEQAEAQRSSFPELRLRSRMFFCAQFLSLLQEYIPPGMELQRFMRNMQVEPMIELLQTLSAKRATRNERVRSSRRQHHAQGFLENALHFLRSTSKHWGFGNALFTIKVANVLRAVPNKRVAADNSKRRTYTDAEVARMQDACLDPVESLLIALLSHVALRASALAHLTYDMLVDSSHNPRMECRVPEKGGVMRVFVPSALVTAKIQDIAAHLRSTHGDNVQHAFVLNARNIHRPVRVITLQKKLSTIARRAKVTNVRVHLHAFRHTLVTRMVRAGNSIDLVAKWIGHSDARTTSHFYWQPTVQDVQSQIIDPFSDTFRAAKKDECISNSLLETANMKLDLCKLIIEAYRRTGADDKVKTLLPHVEDMWNAVAMPTQPTQPVAVSAARLEQETFAR
jgi:integrase